MGKFVNKTEADYASLKAKLDTLEVELIRVHRAAGPAAYRLQTGTAEPGDQETVDRLSALKQQQEQLQLAVKYAEQAEEDRRRAVYLDSDRSRRAATAQHLARLVKASEKMTVALENACSAFNEMIDARRSALASAPPDLRQDAGLEYGLSERKLAHAFLVEVYRITVAKGIPSPLDHAPFAENAKDARGVIKPLKDILTHTVVALRDRMAAGRRRVEDMYSTGAPSTAPVSAEGTASVAPSAGPSKAKDAA